ncbi:hypothetical protein Tco_1235704 [Tanacetum coccineum]
MTEAQPEKPEATLISSSQTLFFAEFTSQLLNDNPEITINDVLKDLVEHKVQSLRDIPVTQEKPVELRPPLVDTIKVHSMSSFNLPEAIDKFVKAHLKNVFPKDVLDFGKIKMKKASKKNTPKYSSTPFDLTSLAIFDQKDTLFQMMSEARAYDKHPAHKALYDALSLSQSVDEDDMDL